MIEPIKESKPNNNLEKKGVDKQDRSLSNQKEQIPDIGTGKVISKDDVKSILDEMDSIPNHLNTLLKKSSLSKSNNFLKISYIRNYTNQEFNDKFSSLDKNRLVNLNNQIKNVDFTNPECDGRNLFDSIGYLTSSSSIVVNNDKLSKSLSLKLQDLNSLCFKWRKIKGDGNCFYRSVIFSYIESIILTCSINRLKDLLCSMNEIFKEEALELNLSKNNIEPDHIMMCMMLIYIALNSKKMENSDFDPISEAYTIFIKCFNNLDEFDLGLILYFRYLLYNYIKSNENKCYKENFPVLIGNLLPDKYELNDGTFLFKQFYEEYLLQLYHDAEKIIIYITPYVIDLNLNVLIYEEENNSLEIMKFTYSKEQVSDCLKMISILYNGKHYDLAYNETFIKTYENYLNLYQKQNNFSEYYFTRSLNVDLVNNINIKNNDSENNVEYGQDIQSEINEIKVKNDIKGKKGIPDDLKSNQEYDLSKDNKELSTSQLSKNSLNYYINTIEQTEKEIKEKKLRLKLLNESKYPQLLSFKLDDLNLDFDIKVRKIPKISEKKRENMSMKIRGGFQNIYNNINELGLKQKKSPKKNPKLAYKRKKGKRSLKELTIKAVIVNDKGNFDMETIKGIIKQNKSKKKKNIQIDFSTLDNGIGMLPLIKEKIIQKQNKKNADFKLPEIIEFTTLENEEENSKTCGSCNISLENQENIFQLCRNCLLKLIKKEIQILYDKFKEIKSKEDFSSYLEGKEIKVSDKSYLFEKVVQIQNRISVIKAHCDPKTIIRNLLNNMCRFCYNDISNENNYINLPCLCKFCSPNCFSKYLLEVNFDYNKEKINLKEDFYIFHYKCTCNRVYTMKDIKMMLNEIKYRNYLKSLDQKSNEIITMIKNFYEDGKYFCCCISGKEIKKNGKNYYEFYFEDNDKSHLVCDICFNKWNNEGNINKRKNIFCLLCDKKHKYKNYLTKK